MFSKKVQMNSGRMWPINPQFDIDGLLGKSAVWATDTPWWIQGVAGLFGERICYDDTYYAFVWRSSGYLPLTLILSRRKIYITPQRVWKVGENIRQLKVLLWSLLSITWFIFFKKLLPLFREFFCFAISVCKYRTF